MPIRFACEHCGVRLSVSSRKAGRKAKCPKCEQMLTIPKTASESSDATSDESQSDDSASSVNDDLADPFSQFLVYDNESELVYGADYEDEESSSRASVDPRKVAVPRKVLYMQGVLLGVVALGCFALGVIVGVSGSGGYGPQDDQPQPCLIRGRVALSDGGLATSPDQGAVAIVVPQEVHPEHKAEMMGLHPGDMEPVDDHEGLTTIRSIGGDYARADQDGRFQLRVPDTGRYFVLVISSGRSGSNTDPPKEVLAQIGRFFALQPELFGGHDYRWREETIRRDRELAIIF